MKQLLSDSIDDFETYSRANGIVNLRGPRSTLKAFLAFKGNVYTHNVKLEHLNQFTIARAATRQPSSIGQDVKALRAFFRWAAQNKRTVAGYDPGAGLKLPKIVQKLRTPLEVQKFPAILEAAGRRHPRDRMLIALGLFTWCRTSEIETMRISHVDLANGRIRTMIHKGKKEVYKEISSNLDAELRRWFIHYQTECGPLNPDWFLVPPIKAELVGPGRSQVAIRPTRRWRQTSNVVKACLEAVGYRVEDNPDLKGCGIHVLRHSGAQARYDYLLAQGYDFAIDVVQEGLSHESRKTTEGYLGVSGRQQRYTEATRGKDMYGLEGVVQLSRGDEDGAGETVRPLRETS